MVDKYNCLNQRSQYIKPACLQACQSTVQWQTDVQVWPKSWECTPLHVPHAGKRQKDATVWRQTPTPSHLLCKCAHLFCKCHWSFPCGWSVCPLVGQALWPQPSLAARSLSKLREWRDRDGWTLKQPGLKWGEKWNKNFRIAHIFIQRMLTALAWGFFERRACRTSPRAVGRSRGYRS
jgi:hypothetical protein